VGEELRRYYLSSWLQVPSAIGDERGEEVCMCDESSLDSFFYIFCGNDVTETRARAGTV
jgi:hypothetical protein